MKKISKKVKKIAIKYTALTLTLMLISFASGAVAESYFHFSAMVGIHLSPEQLRAKTEAQIFPANGTQTKIILGDVAQKLVEGGVIDPVKFNAIYARRGGLPSELANVFNKPYNNKITLTKKNANTYLNILWALGLSNYMELNKKSPVNGKNLQNFASTGGWTLAKKGRGGDYFNKIAAVPLTPEQEAMVVSVAESIFRPCCNNSTFFQDCNHGSALLGMLELGVAQGLNKEELYNQALIFNTYWFPSQYTQTAQLFKATENQDWSQVDPQVILSGMYSSSSGWRINVANPLAKLQGGAARQRGGTSCGV